MQYFIIENGAQAGPFSPEELVNTKNISAETLVWTEGLKDWTPAWQIEEIRQALENRINTQQTPPPVPEAIQNNTKEEKPQKEMSQSMVVYSRDDICDFNYTDG